MQAIIRGTPAQACDEGLLSCNVRSTVLGKQVLIQKIDAGI
jgi:hypothetical protein